MSKTSLQATKITQPLAGKQIQNSKGKILNLLAYAVMATLIHHIIHGKSAA